MNIGVNNLVSLLLNDKESLKKGKRLHKYIENYLKETKFPKFKQKHKYDEKIFSHFLDFNKFMLKDLIFYKSEFKLSFEIKNIKINGIIDAIYKNPLLEEYYIIDWKIAESISQDQIVKYKTIMNIYMLLFKKLFNHKIKLISYLILLHEKHETFVHINIDRIYEFENELLGALDSLSNKEIIELNL